MKLSIIKCLIVFFVLSISSCSSVDTKVHDLLPSPFPEKVYSTLNDLPSKNETIPALVLSEDMNQYCSMWYFEARKRLDHPLLCMCHGGVILDTWYMFPDDKDPVKVDTMANLLSTMFPKYNVVLIVCNPGHIKLHVKNVYYFDKNVLLEPDDYLTDKLLQERNENKVKPGTIKEASTINEAIYEK